MCNTTVAFLPGGNAIAEVSGKCTTKDIEEIARTIEKHDRENQPKTYINDRTGKEHKRKYKLTDEQNARVMDALNALLALADEYEVPVYAAVQTAYDPFKKGTPGSVSGIHVTVPPRTSIAFDLSQTVSNLVCNSGLTSTEFEKLYRCVEEIAEARERAESKKNAGAPETAL